MLTLGKLYLTYPDRSQRCVANVTSIGDAVEEVLDCIRSGFDGGYLVEMPKTTAGETTMVDVTDDVMAEVAEITGRQAATESHAAYVRVG